MYVQNTNPPNAQQFVNMINVITHSISIFIYNDLLYLSSNLSTTKYLSMTYQVTYRVPTCINDLSGTYQ